MMTCETGRESKAQREGLEILQYYREKTRDSDKGDNDDAESAKPLSLDEELTKLKDHTAGGAEHEFGIFETGCRGVVFALCTIPNCELVPVANLDWKCQTEPKQNDKAQESAEKQTSESEENLSPSSPWDPIKTVGQIMGDLKSGTDKESPSSRFVSRMIPIQATCYPSNDEIQATCRALLGKYIPTSPKTFAIAPKKRLCEHISKDDIIKVAATEVLARKPDLKVDLDNPDFTLVVEVCKTLCGVSIVSKCKETFQNFNVVCARENGENKASAETNN